MPRPLHILFIGVGRVCAAWIAAAWTRHLARGAVDVEVASLGRAERESGLDSLMMEAGASVHDMIAAEVNDAALRRADLVVVVAEADTVAPVPLANSGGRIDWRMRLAPAVNALSGRFAELRALRDALRVKVSRLLGELGVATPAAALHPRLVLLGNDQAPATWRTAAAIRSAASPIWPASRPSTITRINGSVPDARTTTRPASPSSASTAATAA